MLTRNDLIVIYLDEYEMDVVKQMATKAEIGGISHIHNKTERKNNLKTDQLIGQIGTCAAIKYFFGNINLYIKTREEINKNPYVGDEGEDIPRTNIDVKTSYMRSSDNPLNYNLLVRPKEKHKGHTYLSALVHSFSDTHAYVYLVGFEIEENLPKQPVKQGIFKGAYRRNNKELKPVKMLSYFINKSKEA